MRDRRNGIVSGALGVSAEGDCSGVGFVAPEEVGTGRSFSLTGAVLLVALLTELLRCFLEVWRVL